jgi:hypothetical protein
MGLRIYLLYLDLLLKLKISLSFITNKLRYEAVVYLYRLGG